MHTTRFEYSSGTALWSPNNSTVGWRGTKSDAFWDALGKHLSRICHVVKNAVVTVTIISQAKWDIYSELFELCDLRCVSRGYFARFATQTELRILCAAQVESTCALLCLLLPCLVRRLDESRERSVAQSAVDV